MKEQMTRARQLAEDHSKVFEGMEKEGLLYWRQFNFDGCPFCDCAEFLDGPEGGLSINFKCVRCGARFNDEGPFGVYLIGWPELDPTELLKIASSKIERREPRCIKSAKAIL